MEVTNMSVKHINITLPDNLITKIDRIAAKQDTTRSGFIRTAVIQLIGSLQKKTLKENLKRGYQEMSGETLRITNEMQRIEEESLKYIGDDLIEW